MGRNDRGKAVWIRDSEASEVERVRNILANGNPDHKNVSFKDVLGMIIRRGIPVLEQEARE